MKTYLDIFRVVVSVVVPLAAFAMGLRAPRTDGLWLWHRPGLLLRSLLTIMILVPLAAVLVLLTLHIQPPVRGGLMIAVLAIGIGPIAAFRRGNASHYETGLILTLLILSIGFLPAAVGIISSVFGLPIPLGAGQVAEVVLTRALFPLLLGLIVSRLAPWFARRIGRASGWLVNIGTLIVVGMAVPIIWKQASTLGASAWLISAAVAAVAIVLGHLLGGPEPETRAVLAAFSALRFPALALLLASVVPNGRTMIPEILVYVVVSAVLVGVYSAVMARRLRRTPAPEPTPLRAPPEVLRPA